MENRPSSHGFDCPRTCRQFERRDLCRFMPLLAALGVQGPVTSHTTEVQIEVRSPDAFGAAAKRMGGRILGQGTHALYSTQEQGYAVQLAGWAYPIVLQGNKLRMDTYNGQWGNQHDVKRLQGLYALEAAREAAKGFGWMVSGEGLDSITIRHPSGGQLTVHSDGRCDAFGFTGRDCHATQQIEAALGRPVPTTYKPEYYDPGGGQLTTCR